MLLLLFFFKMFVGPLSKDKFLPCGDRQQLLLLNLILLQDIYFFLIHCTNLWLHFHAHLQQSFMQWATLSWFNDNSLFYDRHQFPSWIQKVPLPYLKICCFHSAAVKVTSSRGSKRAKNH